MLKKKKKGCMQWEGFAKKGFKSGMKERVGDEKLIIISVAVRGITKVGVSCTCRRGAVRVNYIEMLTY